MLSLSERSEASSNSMRGWLGLGRSASMGRSSTRRGSSGFLADISMDFPSFFSTFSTKSVQKWAKVGGEIKKFAPQGANFRFLIYFPSCLT